MRSPFLVGAVLGATTAVAQLNLPFSRATDSTNPSTIERRASTNLEAPTSGPYPNYVVNITVGTPPQDIQVLVSTGTKYTWVPDVEYCSDSYYHSNNCKFGAFWTNQSSTYELTSDYFRDSTSTNSASGNYFRDTLRVGDTEIKEMTLGLATGGYGYSTQGVLGLAAASSGLSDDAYFLQQLTNAGIISSPGYSFSVDGASLESGNILFGAVDTSKFTGTIKTLRRSTYAAYAGFSVTLSSLNVSESSDATTSEPVLSALSIYQPSVYIDPSSPLTNLPSTLVRKIWSLAGASVQSSAKFATIPCSASEDTAKELLFGLGSYDEVVVRIPLRDLILPRPLYSYYLDVLDENNGTESCMFGIQSISDDDDDYDYDDDVYSTSNWYLGSSVLKGTYVVFDNYNNYVGFAPSRSADESTSSDDTIVPFASYGAYIPESDLGTNSCQNRDCSSGRDRGVDSYHRGGNNGAAIAVIVCICVAVVAAIVIITSLALFCCRRRGMCCWAGKGKKQDGSPGYIIGPAPDMASLPPPPQGDGKVLPPRPVALPDEQALAPGATQNRDLPPVASRPTPSPDPSTSPRGDVSPLTSRPSSLAEPEPVATNAIPAVSVTPPPNEEPSSKDGKVTYRYA